MNDDYWGDQHSYRDSYVDLRSVRLTNFVMRHRSLLWLVGVYMNARNAGRRLWRKVSQ